MPDSANRSPVALGARLAAEFVVIVLGVLVALAVDAAWGRRQEALQEREYYRTLARDLASDTLEYSFDKT